MRQEPAIIDFDPWLQTPVGRYLLEWEQQQLDRLVADWFGFHALQLGLPALDALRNNRMPHRWLADEGLPPPAAPAAEAGAPAAEAMPARRSAVLHCDFDALPFDEQSLDLVVLPHALEAAQDPHQALREVERVLVPEGKVVIVGFNPTSLWGLRRRLARLRRRLALGGHPNAFLPMAGDLIGPGRLRDWLRLLSFEVDSGRFGCYRLPIASQRWLARLGWMESAGDRWWPVFGALYLVVAVKRVRGMRLVGLVRDERVPAKAAPAVVAHNNRRIR